MKSILDIFDDLCPFKPIISKWLEENGYDGLYSDECEPCGCPKEALMLCETVDCLDFCYPGYLHSDGLFYLNKEEEEKSDEAN